MERLQNLRSPSVWRLKHAETDALYGRLNTRRKQKGVNMFPKGRGTRAFPCSDVLKPLVCLRFRFTLAVLANTGINTPEETQTACTRTEQRHSRQRSLKYISSVSQTTHKQLYSGSSVNLNTDRHIQTFHKERGLLETGRGSALTLTELH